ncbi:MAG: glutathione S-transferase family protein [Sandaracinaceae bacterium]|nr:glutathione S-transferase family protein [Sandaracinaceae bacterium]
MVETTIESDTYRLYYWPGLPGRGEFVRLILEEAGAPYLDMARLPKAAGGGVERILELRRGEVAGLPPYAPPMLRAGGVVLAQTAVICDYLGQQFALTPPGEMGRLAALQIQLTIMDVVAEVHDTHHPVGAGKYYEEQKAEAAVAARAFVTDRLPAWLAYFERVATRSPGDYLLGEELGYVDLSLWHLVAGLRYAFPKAMAKQSAPAVFRIAERVRERPSIERYVTSERRLPFNEQGIFRYYSELDFEG